MILILHILKGYSEVLKINSSRVVGGDSETSSELAFKFYKVFVKEIFLLRIHQLQN